MITPTDDSRSSRDSSNDSAGDGSHGPGAHGVPEDLVVRLMGEHTVTIPLWGSRGLMFASANALMRAGVPADLAENVAQWGQDWNEAGTSAELHLRAIALLQPLYCAFEGRYTFVYQP